MSKASTPKTRLQRTSNPTPPEPESSKKYKIDMSQNNPEMDFNITDLPIPQQFAISNEDIQKIADAVKSKLSEDIVKIINEKTAPLITKIDNLEKENRKLKNEVDALEQYGRRSLIRISGILEPTEEGDTTEKVRKIISDYTCLYSGFCFRFFPHFKILNLTPGSDKRTIIWGCLTTAAAFSSGLPTLCERMMLVIS
jgi:hypothetical protein